MNKQPIHEVRFGLIKACVWQNQTRSGLRTNVTFVRLFRDGDTWRESSHFGRDDLLLLKKVADLAHTWIYQHGNDSEAEQD
jgi:hypothetical protein